jgi:predicted nucleic acid-binding protein
VPFVALLDANVLYPIWLCDVLLTVAETEVFQVRWSEEILEEAERNVKKNIPTADSTAISRRFRDMREAFEEAMVTGYEALEPIMTNHPKDRHVLAAAVVGRADVIVTVNLDDFPREACEAYDIDVQHPDEFLCNQWELDEEIMAFAIERKLADYSTPPLSLEQFLGFLEPYTPQFCEVLRASEIGQRD